MGRSVLIVDDHGPFRSVARALLEAGGYQVVGEAGTGEAAVRAAAALRPDVVLLDVGLPDTDGFAVCHRLCRELCAPAVVLCSVRAADSYTDRLAGSPAAGFVAKSALSAAAVTAMLDQDGGPR